MYSSDGPKRVSQREKAHINYAEGDLNDFDAKVCIVCDIFNFALIDDILIFFIIVVID